MTLSFAVASTSGMTNDQIKRAPLFGSSYANVPDFLYPLRFQTNHYAVDAHARLARVWLPLEISERIAQDVQMALFRHLGCDKKILVQVN